MSYHITPEGNAAQCKARKGNCPFAKEDEHFATKKEAVQAYEAQRSGDVLTPTVKPLSTRMLLNSGHEVGYAARSYFRLLNHQNYAQAKGLYGKVKDGAVIDAVKEIHRASIALNDLEEQLTNAQARVNTARTEAQAQGYVRAADTIAKKLTAAAQEFDEAEETIDRLKKKYAGDLAIHKNSLNKLERMANGDFPVERPAGIEKRISALVETRKGIKPIEPVSTILGRGGDMDRVVAAAEKYGKPEYVESATLLRDALAEKAALEEERARLERAVNFNTNEVVRRTIQDELEKNAYSISRTVPTIRANEPRVAQFKDEIRDRSLYEADVTRELNSLIKIEQKTRNVVENENA